METRILPAEGEGLSLACRYISSGELVAFHTETVYGLGADARSDEAVKKIFLTKGRPQDNPLIVHVHRDYDIAPLVDEIPEYTKQLRRAFLPGPLTMIYSSHGHVSPLVSCGLDTLAIRVPASPAAQAFLRAVNVPVAAPSANLSKHVSPVTAQHVYDDFAGRIPLILDGGECRGGIESTVLDCTGPVPLVLRAGLVTRQMIASVVGACGEYHMQAGERPKSPGMAYRHYSPRCKTAYFAADDLEAAIACYEAERGSGGRPYFLVEHSALSALGGRDALDLGGSAEEMAHNLYAQLRAAESCATLLICIQPTCADDAMEGVLNRLRRACGVEDGKGNTQKDQA